MLYHSVQFTKICLKNIDRGRCLYMHRSPHKEYAKNPTKNPNHGFSKVTLWKNKTNKQINGNSVVEEHGV